MIKFVFVIFATALLVEGVPVFPLDVAEAAKNDNWERFRTLLVPGINHPLLNINDKLNLNNLFGTNLPSALAANVESLKPIDGGHVFGHSISTYTELNNDNGQISKNSKGYEVLNNDGKVSKHSFAP